MSPPEGLEDDALIALVQGSLSAPCADASSVHDTDGTWQEFYTRYDPLIRRFASAAMGGQEGVDDAVQETWVQLIHALKDFRYDPSRGKFSTWLYRVVQNTITTLMRRTSRHAAVSLAECETNALASRDAEVSVESDAEAQRQQLRALLETLRCQVSPLSYEVFYKRVVEGQSVIAVAWKLGLTQQQVWYRQHRVKQQLQRLIEQRKERGEHLPQGDLLKDFPFETKAVG